MKEKNNTSKKANTIHSQKEEKGLNNMSKKNIFKIPSKAEALIQELNIQLEHAEWLLENTLKVTLCDHCKNKIENARLDTEHTIKEGALEDQNDDN